jgi:hypothetical protein
MNITLLDKLIIPSLLKREGTFEEIIINKDIKSKVQITQDEVVKYNMQTLEGGNISFNQEGAEAEYDIEFTELEFNTIKDSLKKLQEDKKLTESHIEIYKKFTK